MAVNFVTSDPFMVLNAEIEKKEDGQYSLIHARDLAKQTKEEFKVDNYLDEDNDYNAMIEETRQKERNTKKKSNFKTIQLPFEDDELYADIQNDQHEIDPTSEILSQSILPSKQTINIHISIYDKSSRYELKTSSMEIDKSEFDTHSILNQLKIPDGYKPLYDEVDVDEKGYLSYNDIVTIKVPCDSNQKREVKKSYFRRIIPIDKNDKVVARTIEQKVEVTGINDGRDQIKWSDDLYEFPLIDHLPKVNGMQAEQSFVDKHKVNQHDETVITQYITYYDLMLITDKPKSFNFKVINGETGEIEKEEKLNVNVKHIINSRTNEIFPFKSIDNSPMAISKKALNLNDIQQAYYEGSQIVVIRKTSIKNDQILSSNVENILLLLEQAHDEMPGLTARSPYARFESFSEINDDEKFAKRFLSHINHMRNKLSLSIITQSQSQSQSNQDQYTIIKDKTPSLFELPPEAIADREFAKSIRSLLKSENDAHFKQHYLGSLLLDESISQLSINLNSKCEKSLNNLVYHYEITINQ